MDLFSYAEERDSQFSSPLAYRMRPRSLDEFVGQAHILGPKKWLRKALEEDKLFSLILFGPPGTGKTTLSELIAKCTKSCFEPLNAVTAGVTEIRETIERAKERKQLYQERTILFLDEIHRLNRSQQDVLLPHVEKGTITMIGATTENPSYSINNALLSRAIVVPLYPLSPEEMRTLLLKALHDEERGLGTFQATIEEQALEHLIQNAEGDIRRALNLLEISVITTPPNNDGQRIITLLELEQVIQRKMIRYDKNADHHYDTISAFIKSMRGSDPDATLYYLAKMLHAGEDPRYIARRILVHAAEDVGLADPQAILVASAASHAVEQLGMPEARLPLAESALYIATAPKSNSVYRGINQALELVKTEQNGEVPYHIRNASSKVSKELGYAKGYLYPHNYPKGYVEQQYLPDEHVGKKLYQSSGYGYEAKLDRIHEWKTRKE